MSASKSSLGNILTNFALQPLNLIVAIIVARTLGPEDKGIFTYVTLITGLFVPIVLLGFNAGSLYYISTNRYQFRNSFLSAQIIGFLHGCFAAFLIWILWKFQWLGETGNSLDSTVIYFIMIFAPFTGLNLTLYTTLRGASRFKTVNVLQIISGVLNAAALSLFVIILQMGLAGALYALFFMKVILNLLFIIFIIRMFSIKFVIVSSYIRLSYQYGIRSWLGNIANRANAKLDHVILSYFASASTLGIYSVAYNYTSLLTQPLNGIMPVLFNKIAAGKNKEGRAHITELVHKSMLWIAVPISLVLGISSEWLIPLLYGEAFAVSPAVILILLPGIISFMVTRRCLTKYLGASGFPGKTSIIQATGALFGLIFYLIFIPSLGIVGAALGTTLAFILAALQAYYYYRNDIYPQATQLFNMKWRDVLWMRGKILEALPIRIKNLIN